MLRDDRRSALTEENRLKKNNVGLLRLPNCAVNIVVFTDTVQFRLP